MSFSLMFSKASNTLSYSNQRDGPGGWTQTAVVIDLESSWWPVK